MKRKFVLFLAWFFFIAINLIPQITFSVMFYRFEPSLDTEIVLRTITLIVTGLLSADAFKVIDDLNEHE